MNAVLLNYFSLPCVDHSTKRHVGLDRERSVTKSVQSAIILLHRKSAEIHGRRERAGGGRGSSPATQGEER